MKIPVLHAMAIVLVIGSDPAFGVEPDNKIDYGTARLERRLTIVRASGEITLDGLLDEPAWRDAPVANHFIQNDPHEGEPATFDTEVRVLYDDEAVYIGVFAQDDEPGRIIVNDLKKDFNTSTSDNFSVIFDTFRDERNGYRFTTNPAGAKWDAQSANEGRENNANWDGIWDVKTRITERGWYAEIRIPFRTLKFKRGDPQIWGLNFERKLRRLNEDSYWAPLPRIYELEKLSLAGTLEGMQGLRPGKNIRVKPFAMTSSSTVRGSTVGDFDAGLDVKYGVTSGLTWDFTLKTDFSQVEADEQQVNLTRVSLFFPEKRDFFLENSGIFQFGATDRSGGGVTQGRQNGPQDMLLFFSRRIGLSEDGQTIPILGGTRLTGRQGRYSLGVLTIQQQRAGDMPAANFTALRIRRNILANSDIGAVLLNKDENGPRYNRVAGVDANFRFGFLAFNGYAAKSVSPQFVMRGSGEDLATRASVNYLSRVWQLRAFYNTVGERFNDEMGFVQRRGVDNGYLYVSWSARPKWLSRFRLREIRPHWQFDQFTRRDGAGLESRYQDWHLPVYFNSGAFFETGVNPNVEEVRRPFTINSARAVRVDADRYTFDEYFVIWNSNSADRFSYSSRYSIGEFYNGYRRGYAFGPSFRPNEHFNTAVNLQINDIELSGSKYVSKLITARVNYNLSTKMFVNALLQFNTDSRQVSSNLRFNIIHRPLSDFFFVYNEQRDERSGDLINRALIAKMTYLVAF
jgi:hypothetical protein